MVLSVVLIHLIVTIFCLVTIICSCLFFSQATEHLGQKLKLSNNAVGSVLAVIGTSLPETIVPLVAIFGSVLFKKDIVQGQNIALGAIFASPFMLLTLASFFMGVSLLITKRKNQQLNIDVNSAKREYKYFIFAFGIALFASFIPCKIFKVLIAVFLLILYLVFVLRTILKSTKNSCENTEGELFLCRLFKFKAKDKITYVVIQFLVSIAFLTVFSHFFVCEIEYFSKILNINSVVLSLFITPFATELPECINSIIWIKEEKDDLAFSNVLGGIVFQSMIPTSIGLVFSPWILSKILYFNASLSLICAIIFMLSLIVFKKIKTTLLLFVVLIYLLFFIYILI